MGRHTLSPRRGGPQDLSGEIGPGVVVLSTADWDAEIWTNKQHTSRALRDAGFSILYVESFGLRAPRISTGDVLRILKRIRRLFQRPVPVEPGIARWSPPSIPLQRFELVRWVNRIVVSGLLRHWARSALGCDALLWTYNPMTTSLVDIPDDATLIYHCVDDVAAQPGMPAEVMQQCERSLVERADHVFVTSRTLEAKWSALRPVQYDPNCVDLTRFAAATAEADSCVLAHVPNPRIGFVGTLAAYKLDTQLLLELSEAEPGCSIVMIGPKEDGDRSLRRVLARPNVFHIDTQPYDDLPALMRTFAVGIIPARTDDYAQSMFPMKFFEYLAAGVPVVSTDLPALREYTSVAAVVDRTDFVAAVGKVLDGDVPDARARRRACEENTYSARTTRMLAAIAGARARR